MLSELPGPYAIKLYVHLLRETDGSGGISNDLLHAILKSVEQDFSQHKIYFLLACVNDIKNSLFLGDIVAPSDLFNAGYSQQDGINLFLRPGIGETGGGGVAQGVVSKNTRVAVTNSPEGIKVVSHELGHTLGLYHTFRGSIYAGESGGSPELVNGTNCCIAGDLVCDTPADPFTFNTENGYGLQDDCSWIAPPNQMDPSGALYTNTDPKNIMGYAGNCQQYFTPGQGERMRYLIATNVDLAPVVVNDALVHENTTWDTPRFFNTDVYILPNVTLRIRANVNMAAGRKIIVDKGAILNAKDVTLSINNTSNTCLNNGPFWKGIEVRGGSLQENGASIVLHNCTVELAESAIFYPVQGTSASYGLVNCALTTFRNNMNVINFISSSPQLAAWNLSPNRFTKCSFITDSSYPASTFSGFVEFALVRNNLFQGCTFNNQLFQPSEISGFNHGIFAYQSKVTAKSYCSPGYNEMACPPEKYTGAIFSGFSKGIDLRESNGVLVKDVNFSNSFTGISANASNSLMSKENVYSLSQNIPASAGFKYGIEMRNSGGFTIEDNHFIGEDLAQRNNYGIQVFNTGGTADAIRRNYFTNLSHGIRSLGVNANATFPFIGLSFFCNVQDHNLDPTAGSPFDFWVSGSIANPQGTANKPAGNVFSLNAAPTGSDFNKFSAPVTYYYYESGAGQEPLNVVGVTKTSSPFNPSCEDNLINGPLPELDIIYQAEKQKYEGLKNRYDQYMDGWDTPGLLSDIENTLPAQATALVNDLLSYAPFLSAEVLEAVYSGAAILTDAQRCDVLLANPDGLKSPGIRDLFESGAYPLPVPCKTQLLEGPYAATARTALEGEMGLARSNANRAVNAALEILYQDTLNQNTSIRAWLGKKDDFYAKIERLETWFKEGSYTTFVQEVNDLVAAIGASDEHYNTIKEYRTLMFTLVTALTNDRNLFSLDSTELATLNTLAQSGGSFAGEKARNFLEVYYGYSFEDSAALQSGNTTRPAFEETQVVPPQSKSNYLKVYPNPATDLIQVAFNNEGGALIRLCRMTGEALVTIVVSPGEAITPIKTTALPDGLYLITLVRQNLPPVSRIVVISR